MLINSFPAKALFTSDSRIANESRCLYSMIYITKKKKKRAESWIFNTSHDIIAVTCNYWWWWCLMWSKYQLLTPAYVQAIPVTQKLQTSLNVWFPLFFPTLGSQMMTESVLIWSSWFQGKANQKTVNLKRRGKGAATILKIMRAESKNKNMPLEII